MPDRPATVRTIADLRAAILPWRARGDSVALVPTMGALHAGHVALIDRARTEARRTVVSIFVNPIQFGDARDLETYPRDEAADRAMLTAAGADLLFAPDAGEVYPRGFATRVAVDGLSRGLCGDARPGHFEGVATVVAKLFNMVRPDCAVFGEKDYQQLLVIRRLAADLDTAVRVIGHPTVREDDGLAMSSRNRRLSPDERRVAPRLYSELAGAAAAIAAGAPARAALDAARAALVAAGFGPIDYLELRDGETLACPVAPGRPARIFAAAHLGVTRLIDNVRVR